MKAATTSRFHSSMSAASRQRSARRRSMSSSSRSIRVGRLGMSRSGRTACRTDAPGVSVAPMGKIRFGPARVPSRESPEAAVELLVERGYTACEIDFEGGFWMDYPWAERFGELARDAEIALSVHAPLAGFMGHVERDKKHRWRSGCSTTRPASRRSAGAELVVFHPGFLLGRTRERRARRRRRAARRAARAARRQGPRRAVRRRGDGPRARARHRRGRVRDRRAARLGAAGDRLRPPARGHRRRVHDVEGVPRRARGRGRGARAGAPFHIHF